MCGRYTLTSPAEALRALFDLEIADPDVPRFNIAPTQQIIWVRMSESGTYEAQRGRWGLVPFFSKDPAGGDALLLNARSETVAVKPSFRAAFKRRRCLIPADGFFEWKKVGEKKQPYHIRLQGMHPFAIAGLYEHWSGKDGTSVDSCTLITTAPNKLMTEIHDRMPVILDQENYRTWTDPKIDDPAILMPLLAPYRDGRLEAVPVSTKVNNPRNDDPRCLEPSA